jgi:hypothetical protein
MYTLNEVDSFFISYFPSFSPFYKGRLRGITQNFLIVFDVRIFTIED